MNVCEGETIILTKRIRRGFLFWENGIQNDKGVRMNLGAEPARVKICTVPTPGFRGRF